MKQYPGWSWGSSKASNLTVGAERTESHGQARAGYRHFHRNTTLHSYSTFNFSKGFPVYYRIWSLQWPCAVGGPALLSTIDRWGSRKGKRSASASKPEESKRSGSSPGLSPPLHRATKKGSVNRLQTRIKGNKMNTRKWNKIWGQHKSGLRKAMPVHHSWIRQAEY